MGKYLIDTDVLIDHLRGEEKALHFLKQLNLQKSQIFYSVISKAEIYSGIIPDEEEEVSLLFRSMNEVPIDGEIAEISGRFKKMFFASHGLLLPDAFVAASAKRVGATLITLNKRHYPMRDIEIQIPYGKK